MQVWEHTAVVLRKLAGVREQPAAADVDSCMYFINPLQDARHRFIVKVQR